MRNKFLVFCAALLAHLGYHTASSQLVTYRFTSFNGIPVDNDFKYTDKHYKDTLAALNGVNMRVGEVSRYNQKGKLIKQTRDTTWYNREGIMTAQVYVYPQKPKNNHTWRLYLTESGYPSRYDNQFGKQIYSRRYVKGNGIYPQETRIYTYKSGSKKQKLYLLTKNVLDSSGLKLKTISYNTKDTFKIASFMEFEYDSSRNLAYARGYNRKAKMIFTYDFTCRSTGSLVGNKKAQSMAFCTTREVLPNGHVLTVEIEESKWGISKKVIEKDTVTGWISETQYNGKLGDIKYIEVTNAPGDTNSYTYKYYYDAKVAGKEKPRFQTQYLSKNGKTLRSESTYWNKRGKVNSHYFSTYRYDEKGFLIQTEETDLEKGSRSITTYSRITEN